MKKSFKGYNIIYVDTDIILLYKNFAIYVYRQALDSISLVCNIPISALVALFGRFRLLNRLFRLSPRCCEKLSDCQYVFSLRNKIWVANIEQRSVTIINTERAGFSTPLNICRFGDMVLWGDYGSNPLYEEVNIYSLDKNMETNIVYTFPSGTIRHIHNIVYDKNLDIFWVLAGDNEEKAGIYKASIDWKKVEPLKIGKQKYRAVVGFPCMNGFVYATDSVEQENFIYHIDECGNETVISTINGSCIYGGEAKDFYIFSTTVESPEGRGVKALLSTKLGGGIKSNQVHLVAVEKSTLKPYLVRTFVKDTWSYKLLQYGYVYIPSGQQSTNSLLVAPMACKYCDGENIIVEIGQ